MAKNQEPAKPVEHETDSSEEESDGETSSEEESDSEPEPTQIAKTPWSSTPAAAKKPLLQSPSKPSQAEEESRSESESDSDGPNRKPIAAHKSLNGARKPRPEPAASTLATPTESSAGKRRAVEKETRAEDSKKAKLVKMPSDESISESESDSDGPNPEVRAIETEPMNGKRKSLHTARKSQPLPAAGKRQAEEKETLAKGSKKPTNQVHRARKPRPQPTPTKSTGTNDSKNTKAVKRVTENSKKQPSQINKKEEDKILILPGMNNYPAKDKSVGGSVEEMILTIGDKMFLEGKGVEEWKRLKVEEREVYLMRLDVKAKQTKLDIAALKSG